jgi:hypothetical protein
VVDSLSVYLISHMVGLLRTGSAPSVNILITGTGVSQDSGHESEPLFALMSSVDLVAFVDLRPLAEAEMYLNNTCSKKGQS